MWDRLLAAYLVATLTCFSMVGCAGAPPPPEEEKPLEGNRIPKESKKTKPPSAPNR